MAKGSEGVGGCGTTSYKIKSGGGRSATGGEVVIIVVLAIHPKERQPTLRNQQNNYNLQSRQTNDSSTIH